MTARLDLPPCADASGQRTHLVKQPCPWQGSRLTHPLTAAHVQLWQPVAAADRQHIALETPTPARLNAESAARLSTP